MDNRERWLFARMDVLLGHSSSKTAEMYTHNTTKGFGNLKSPLDEMDV